ncbi:E3 ubiquitin-protein ligase RHA2A [Cardamine amara subsp. amara]|uniref:E3 ubiquitin-protein ligase RHA2A n=1 Tax=Cardamine amara subsp. amara TaxID=228776 RepID=A0ABD1A9T1_CARAN
MGLQGQLSDVSSDSIPLMLLSLIAVFVNHLRSFLLRICASTPNLPVDDASIASGLANIIVLADQLSLNRLFSYQCSDEVGSECVVCLSKLKEGEEICFGRRWLRLPNAAARWKGFDLMLFSSLSKILKIQRW